MYTNWGNLLFLLPLLFYCKLGQTLLQIGAASLLQIGESADIDWAAITN